MQKNTQNMNNSRCAAATHFSM